MTVFYEVMGYKDINQSHKYMLENMVLDRSIVIMSEVKRLPLSRKREKIAPTT